MLAGGIAHDFNNLLTGILGDAEPRCSELPADHPARRHIQTSSTAAQRAADLTRQMLAYSGKGRFVVRRSTCRRWSASSPPAADAILEEGVLRLELARARCRAIEADATQISRS